MLRVKNNFRFYSCVPSIFVLFSIFSVVSSVADDSVCVLPLKGELRGNVKLNSACTYYQSVRIVESNTHLDCNGATLEGEGKRAVGIQIDGKKQPIENVTVENCRIQSFKNRGINITSGLKIKDFSADTNANYKLAPRKVMIDGVTVLGSGRGGVYFDSYVTDSSLSNSTIEGSGKVGVYLEQGSQRIQIVNNIIRGNGVDRRREGLAIDSSAHNLIKGNYFSNNAAGGVFIYKNCGENFFPVSRRFVGSQVTLILSKKTYLWVSQWGCGSRRDKAGI